MDDYNLFKSRPPISPRLEVSQAEVQPKNVRQRRSSGIVPLGHFPVARPKRVNSSTSASKVSDAAAIGSGVDEYVQEAGGYVTPMERHIAEMVDSGSVSVDEAAHALADVWSDPNGYVDYYY